MKYQKIPWKYRLVEELVLQSGILHAAARTEWIILTPEGKLILETGYAWDGPSGPAVDTPDFMAPSAGHDALFQLMRLGMLDPDTVFRLANQDMYRWCRDRGMWPPRARWCTWAVDRFSRTHAEQFYDRGRVYEAP